MHCHEAVLSQDKGLGIGIARPRHLIAARGSVLTSAQVLQEASDAVYGPGDDTGSTLQLVCTAMHGQDKNPSRGRGSLHKFSSLRARTGPQSVMSAPRSLLQGAAAVTTEWCCTGISVTSRREPSKWCDVLI